MRRERVEEQGKKKKDDKNKEGSKKVKDLG